MVALIEDGDVHRGSAGELPAGLEPAKARAHDQHFFRHPAAPLLHSAAMGIRFPAEASWLEIDGGALAHNAAIFREVLGAGVRLGAVLKGNAYGHGFAEVLPLARTACDALYAIEARDALAIREIEARTLGPRRQVLVLGAVDAEEAVELARANVEVAIADPGQARFVPALRAAGLRLRGHIHVDTGLGREGFTPAELPAALGWLVQARDVVRVGIALYGLWPSSETRLSARALLGRVPELRPMLSWRCRSQLTKWLPAGSYVGYGCTYRCPVDTRIAVLPMGYADGYPRLLSS